MKNVRNTSENVLPLKKKCKVMNVGTLWSIYSMLKSIIQLNNDIDISIYMKLIIFLKQQSVGYVGRLNKSITYNLQL